MPICHHCTITPVFSHRPVIFAFVYKISSSLPHLGASRFTISSLPSSVSVLYWITSHRHTKKYALKTNLKNSSSQFHFLTAVPFLHSRLQAELLDKLSILHLQFLFSLCLMKSSIWDFLHTIPLKLLLSRSLMIFTRLNPTGNYSSPLTWPVSSI